VAPPDQHLLLQDGVTRLSRGPREHSLRPAIDPLFRSAAWAYDERVAGVLLSGSLYDGTAGLIEIRRLGGVALVQAPWDAPDPVMPLTAISRDHPDYVLPVPGIVTTLRRLVLGRAPQPSDQK
jgi:two-component system chemotaxis response regulator CheB